MYINPICLESMLFIANKFRKQNIFTFFRAHMKVIWQRQQSFAVKNRECWISVLIHCFSFKLLLIGQGRYRICWLGLSQLGLFNPYILLKLTYHFNCFCRLNGNKIYYLYGTTRASTDCVFVTPKVWIVNSNNNE